MDRNTLNNQGIYLCDVFHLNYYGVHVFFQVCRTSANSVCIYELKTKVKNMWGRKRIAIFEDAKPEREHTLVVPLENNIYMRSNFECAPIKLPDQKDYCLPIKVDYDSPLYKRALEVGAKSPLVGVAYAEKVNEWYNKWWPYIEPQKEEEQVMYFA